jgi:hypothetical protein
MKFLSSIIMFFFIAQVSHLSMCAQEKEPDRNIILNDSLLAKKDSIRKLGFVNKVKTFLAKERTFIIAPEFARKPETGFLTGVYYLQLFRLSPKSDTATRTSNVESYFDYTERKQIIAQIRNNLMFKKERFILRGENIYTKFPSLFWGVGTKTTVDMQEPISFEMASVSQRLVVRMGSRYFAGVQYQYQKVSNVQHIKGGLFDQYIIPGSQGSTTSGAGFVFLYDSRDNILNSYKGLYIDASVLFNQQAFGGEFFYNNVTIDIRKYISLSKKKVRVLALQALINYNDGNVPFRQMATMGGDMIMRGYYTGRFRDKVIAAAQAEFRFKVWKAIGFTVFTSIAEVGPKPETFNMNDIHYTIGGCFRFMINKVERLNIGIDTGFGYQTSGLYFNSGEAF